MKGTVGLFHCLGMGVAVGCGPSGVSPDRQLGRGEEAPVAGEPGPAASGQDRDEALGDGEDGAATERKLSPLDLIEAMKKSLLKQSRSQGDATAKIRAISVWKSPKKVGDVGSVLGFGAAPAQQRHLYCHYHGETMACHSVQAPGLSGNPESGSVPNEREEKPSLPPIDPFS